MYPMLQMQGALGEAATGQLRIVEGLGAQLAESELWKPFVEDCTDSKMRSKIALVLENTRQWLEGLDEMTRAITVGDFQKYAFPLVRAIFPELRANSLVSVQPMLGPTSLVFYMDMIYGSNKGNVVRGTRVFDSVALGPNNPNYSSSLVEQEAIATGDGNTNSFGPLLSYSPVRSGTVQITDGTQLVTDDGNGNLVGDGSGTINYVTGQITALAFTVAVTNGTSITCDYEYDLEAQSNIPEIDLILTSSPVVARPRKLKAKWSLEAAFNMRALHGLEAEVELTSAVGAEIRFEIDREIINDITRIVPASNLTPIWSKSRVFKDTDSYTGPASGSTTIPGLTEHYLSITNHFVDGNSRIFKATGRAMGQWIVAGVGVCNVVETLPGFVAVPGMPNGMTKGIYEAGTLNGRWVIYKDPFYPDNQWLMGYKGTSFLEAGYIYCPYIPMYTTPLIVLDDFVGRKGIATQYGKKVVNNRFYAKGQVAA